MNLQLERAWKDYMRRVIEDAREAKAENIKRHCRIYNDTEEEARDGWVNWTPGAS